MFFKCKVCDEKDKRIQDLKVEIQFLQKVVSGYTLPAHSNDVAREADAILSGTQDQLEPSPITDDELLAERNRILSGDF